MDDQQSARNVAYVNSQLMCAMVELEAMKSANRSRERQNLALAYSEGDFRSLIDKYQMGHNSVVTNLNEGR